MTALDAEMERDFQRNDPRTGPRRRADALANICLRALDTAGLGSTRRARPHMMVVADLERLDGNLDSVHDARAEAVHHSRAIMRE